MRYLGIDYGTKRIGVAISDEGGTLAFPKEVIINDKNTLTRIEQIIKEENIREIIIGESLDLSGEPNKLMADIAEFIKELKLKYNLPTHLQKEFMTSFEAHGRKGKESNNARETVFKKTKDLDASAAALILQRYLDRKTKLENNN